MADFELVGKKKKVIDHASYGRRSAAAADSFPLPDDKGRIVFLEKGTTTGPDAPSPDLRKDILRMALGKSWIVSNDGELINTWAPKPKIWYGQELYIECNFPPESTSDLSGDPVGHTSTKLPRGAVPPIAYQSDMVTEQKIVIACDLPKDQSEYVEHPERAPTLEKWMFLMKAGLYDTDGVILQPIVSNPNHTFSDLYHETFLPFTKKELASKQPSGKAFFADVRTFYNERVGSSSRTGGRNMSFENKIKSVGFNNSIPSVYGFLDIMYDELDLDKIYQELSGSNDMSPSLVSRPFSVLTTYYGKINKETIQKFTNINYKRDDVTAFYEDYFDEWAEEVSPAVTWLELLGLTLLEATFTNIAFSPDVTNFIDKIEKYKNYFPFYGEIEFTAQILTEIGDLIKNTLMTKYLSNIIAENSTHRINLTTFKKEDLFRSLAGNSVGSGPGALGWYKGQSFHDFYEEKVYEDINADSQLSVAELATPLATQNEIKSSKKDVLKIFRVLKEFIDDNSLYTYPEEDGSDLDDIQNFLSYVHSETSTGMGDISTCNAIFKTIFGNILLDKIIKTYKAHRRDYIEIINGKPAYTEDIFYRIEKLVKHKGTSSFVHLQNIIIPNTSDLDIVKYVDTQVKYADDAVYKYNVYAERIVFGSLYRYIWINSAGNEQKPTEDYKPGNIEEINIIPDPVFASSNPLAGTGVKDGGSVETYNAQLRVKIEPNIVMMEDLIFSTPEVRILDKPPVAPDVNIIPYRAVNNRIKILFNGMVDRYRDFPIYLNKEKDEAKFNFIKDAQFSPDGKVEFGSDDPIKKFEIFRIQTKPKKYTDFELYKTVNKNFYEEEILPNTKYYYTFRAIDNHNHISNPSAIFEVELIDEHGAVKPMIRVVGLKKPKLKEYVKECQKYIYIKPTPQQVYTTDSKGVDYMFTSYSENTKRRFKVRMTSKSTGKKLDVNLAFKKKKKTVKT